MPVELVQRVRSAAVPPYLSALFGRLGVAVGLVVEVPEGGSVPVTALQLIKLGGQGTALQPAVLVSVPAGAPPRVRLEHDGRRLVLVPAAPVRAALAAA